jgi:hypothetical protein
MVMARHAGQRVDAGWAIGRDLKGKVSPDSDVAGILFAFVGARIACAIYPLLGLLWLIPFVPDRRIERAVRRPRSRLRTGQLPSDREKFSVEGACMRTAITSSFATVSTRVLKRWRHAGCLFGIFRHDDQRLGRAVIAPSELSTS